MAVRIVHVVEALGVGGGVENGIANLIARMDPDRFEHILCAVFHLGSQIERYPADRVRLISLAQQPRRFSTQVRPLTAMIRKWKPDVVHSRNWGAMEAVIAGRWAGSCSVIHSEHGVELDPGTEPRRRSWFRRGAFELAHRVFAVSGELRNALARGIGFPAARIGVIRNGVDRERFRPDPAARNRFRAELGISEEQFCIGCVGRLSSIKDYPTTLRAAEAFGASRNSWQLLIAGSGAERDQLERTVQASPVLRGRVRFLGAHSRVPEFLQAIDVYVLPSLSEGISNSLLEAMATGLPAVATDVGGNPEVIVPGESGLLFRAGDADELARLIAGLHASPEMRRRLGEGALRRVAAEFSLAGMAAAYGEMYSSLARRYATGPRVDEKRTMTV